MVITPHLQGTWHTRDIHRPFAYETMTDDLAALLAHLKVEKASILGQSMGAGVALRMGLRHPNVVDRLVLVSTTAASSGWHPKVQQELVEMGRDAAKFAAEVAKSDAGRAYPEVNWETLFRKTREFQQRPYDITGQVRELVPKTLLIFADEDAITPRHIVEFWEALGGGAGQAGLNGDQRSQSSFAIMPGSNHSTATHSPTFVQTVRDFLKRRPG